VLAASITGASTRWTARAEQSRIDVVAAPV
jgi:hypothetical protein